MHCDHPKRPIKRSEPSTIQAGEGFSNAVIILSPITVHHSIFHLNPPAPNHPYLWPAFLRLITPPSQHHPRTWTPHSSARKIYLWKRGSVHSDCTSGHRPFDHCRNPGPLFHHSDILPSMVARVKIHIQWASVLVSSEHELIPSSQGGFL